MSGFTEGVLECNGLPIRYAEAGEGRAVVVFPAGDGELSVLPPGRPEQEPVLADDFICELHRALATHNHDLAHRMDRIVTLRDGVLVELQRSLEGA